MWAELCSTLLSVQAITHIRDPDSKHTAESNALAGVSLCIN